METPPIADGAAASPVAVQILRTVRPGCEARFEAALHDFIARSMPGGAGGLGVHVLRPAPGSGSREYGILRRFADAASRDAFYRSPLFAEWEAVVAPLVEGGAARAELSGLETWFTLPRRQAVIPPPRWKMALSTLLAVYPLSLVLPAALEPLAGRWPGPARGLLVAAAMVAALTWIVMPALARMLHPWLQPDPFRRKKE